MVNLIYEPNCVINYELCLFLVSEIIILHEIIRFCNSLLIALNIQFINKSKAQIIQDINCIVEKTKKCIFLWMISWLYCRQKSNLHLRSSKTRILYFQSLMHLALKKSNINVYNFLCFPSLYQPIFSPEICKPLLSWKKQIFSLLTIYITSLSWIIRK